MRDEDSATKNRHLRGISRVRRDVAIRAVLGGFPAFQRLM